MNQPDDLRRGLDNVAETIEIGDLDVHTVRSSARRRLRRARVAAGVGVVAVIAGASVAVVTFRADDEPDTLATAEVDEPDSTEVPPTTVDDEPPSTELSTAPARTVQMVERPASVGQPVGANGAPAYGEWIAAWGDGFLVGSQSFPSQPLPAELPEEVVALFPQEVRDVFGGELPATIAEATQMLSDAGLLETVSDILAANPGASDAIYSVDTRQTPTLDVRFTTDGVTWEPIEMTLPTGATYFSNVTTVGDRLVVSYGSNDPLSGRSVDGIVRVATTADLVEWTIQEIVVPPPPIELPEQASWSVQAGGLASNESGWVANVYAGIELDPMSLVPAEMRAQFEQSTDGYSSWFDDVGIHLELSGSATDALTFTWDELGIAPDVATYLSEQAYESTIWAATWDGVPARSQTRVPTDRILATPAGFVGLDAEISYSADGLSWVFSPFPIENGYISAAFSFDGGIIALVGTPGGVQVQRLDERGGSPMPLDIPGLPENTNGGGGFGSRLGAVLDAGDQGPPPPPLVVEVEGHRLTIDNATGNVEVVEIATDEIVATADVGRGIDEESPIVFDMDGVTVTDPATGTVVVTFPNDVLESASRELYEADPTSAPEPYVPDTWLLATLDGETFVLDDLDDGSGDSYGPGALAANGSRLLLQAGGNWVVYDLA